MKHQENCQNPTPDPQVNPEPGIEAVPEPPNENLFRCIIEGCLFRSKYRNVLKRHIDVEHPADDEDDIDPELLKDAEFLGGSVKQDIQKCPGCEKYFLERFQLRNHMFDKHNLILSLENENEANTAEK